VKAYLAGRWAQDLLVWTMLSLPVNDRIPEAYSRMHMLAITVILSTASHAERNAHHETVYDNMRRVDLGYSTAAQASHVHEQINEGRT